MLWVVNHLIRDYIRRQTRRLALRNDLTPGQPRRIADESEYFNVPLKERPLKIYAVQVVIRIHRRT